MLINALLRVCLHTGWMCVPGLWQVASRTLSLYTCANKRMDVQLPAYSRSLSFCTGSCMQTPVSYGCRNTVVFPMQGSLCLCEWALDLKCNFRIDRKGWALCQGSITVECPVGLFSFSLPVTLSSKLMKISNGSMYSNKDLTELLTLILSKTIKNINTKQ